MKLRAASGRRRGRQMANGCNQPMPCSPTTHTSNGTTIKNKRTHQVSSQMFTNSLEIDLKPRSITKLV